MAKNDVKIVSSPYDIVPTKRWQVEDRTTSSDTAIYAGEPVKLAADDSDYVIHLATGDPAIGTDIVVGIAAADSTETATADGYVDVYLPLPGIIYRCAATTGSNLAASLELHSVTFDLTGTTFTVDEDETSDNDVHGLTIVSVDTDADTVDFMIKTNCTVLQGNI